MSAITTLIGDRYLDREQLALIATPEGTATHKPIPHITVVNEISEVLSFRQISIVKEEFAVTKDDMRLFGTMTLSAGTDGVNFALGLRNSNDKSLALGITVGYRVFVCQNLAFVGEYTPVLRKHTKNVDLPVAISMGIDQWQRSFKPLTDTITRWKQDEVSETMAKRLIYKAFIEGQLDAPARLAKDVHHAYFNPPHAEFEPRTKWSLNNAFSEAFKQLEPVPAHKAASALGRFFEAQQM